MTDADTASAAPIRSLLVKVASRCNLKCDYCYMYEHADQSWRLQPRTMSDETRRLLADRLKEYVKAARPERMSVILHGGEPLLMGAPSIVRLATDLRSAARPTHLDIGLQTNGVLLDEGGIAELAQADIAISLSLDGPADVHDRHRPTRNGQPSHEAVVRALELLQGFPASFSGVIAVVDPSTDPGEVIRWFADRDVPALDLLLPDANHDHEPEGRSADPDLYKSWMLRAFDYWYDQVPNLRIRTFDALIEVVCGLPSGTDAFGLGEVSLLTIETDGSYHDLDVLKTTYEGRTALGSNLSSHSIDEAAGSARILDHNRLLTLRGLSPTCQSCAVVEICGGGSVPHRYRAGSEADGFDNPSVYCGELKALIQHVRERVSGSLAVEVREREPRRASDVFNWSSVDSSEGGLLELEEVRGEWSRDSVVALMDVAAGAINDSDGRFDRLQRASLSDQERVATRPSVQLWLRARAAAHSGAPLRALDGSVLRAEVDDLIDVEAAESSTPRLHRSDPLLRAPFGYPIEFLDFAGPRLEQHRAGLKRALDLVDTYKRSLRHEISVICSDIQLVRDVSAHPDKSVSFSDDTVPGAIYVSPPDAWSVVSTYDIADSIIHEHRHQKLYLVSRQADLIDEDFPLVVSPWREEPRPPSGVLHAVWVFVELVEFWSWAALHSDNASVRDLATYYVRTNRDRLMEGITVLTECELSPAGRELTEHLKRRAGL